MGVDGDTLEPKWLFKMCVDGEMSEQVNHKFSHTALGCCPTPLETSEQANHKSATLRWAAANLHLLTPPSLRPSLPRPRFPPSQSHGHFRSSLPGTLQVRDTLPNRTEGNARGEHCLDTRMRRVRLGGVCGHWLLHIRMPGQVLQGRTCAEGTVSKLTQVRTRPQVLRTIHACDSIGESSPSPDFVRSRNCASAAASTLTGWLTSTWTATHGFCGSRSHWMADQLATLLAGQLGGTAWWHQAHAGSQNARQHQQHLGQGLAGDPPLDKAHDVRAIRWHPPAAVVHGNPPRKIWQQSVMFARRVRLQTPLIVTDSWSVCEG